MSKNSSAKYYHDHKERLHKQISWKLQKSTRIWKTEAGWV